MGEPKFIRCSCGQHLIVLEQDDEIGEVYMSFFRYGHNRGNEYDIRFVLRSIWHTIRYGSPYSDSIVLEKKYQKELGKFLLKEEK